VQVTNQLLPSCCTECGRKQTCSKQESRCRKGVEGVEVACFEFKEDIGGEENTVRRNYREERMREGKSERVPNGKLLR
jgi:hypothetical protein